MIAMGFVAILYSAGVFAPVTKAVGKTVQFLTGETENTDPHVVTMYEKTINHEDLYFYQSGNTAVTAPAVDSSRWVVNPSSPGQFNLLDGRQFVIAPDTAKVFTFTINAPNYPIRFIGSMQTGGTNSAINFSLIESERYATLARMSTGYKQFQNPITSDILKKYKFGDENYLDVGFVDIGPNSKDAPTFLAVFENSGESAQSITAALQLSYSAGVG